MLPSFPPPVFDPDNPCPKRIVRCQLEIREQYSLRPRPNRNGLLVPLSSSPLHSGILRFVVFSTAPLVTCAVDVFSDDLAVGPSSCVPLALPTNPTVDLSLPPAAPMSDAINGPHPSRKDSFVGRSILEACSHSEPRNYFPLPAPRTEAETVRRSSRLVWHLCLLSLGLSRWIYMMPFVHWQHAREQSAALSPRQLIARYRAVMLRIAVVLSYCV